jgi:hypothetical protein
MSILPRPVTPKSALADLRSMLTGPLPHKWPLLGLSVAVTWVIMYGFYLDAKPAPVGPQIMYVESWMADRKDSDILKKQKADLAQYEVALEKKQHEFQSVADKFGIEWKNEEVRNRVRRKEVIAAINKQLDQRIAKAEADEAAKAGKPTKLAARP